MSIRSRLAIRLGLCALLSAASAGVAFVATPDRATASHSFYYVAPGAPFTGSWGYRTSSSCSSAGYEYSTVPPYHAIYRAQFSLDYYGCSGTPGRFYPWNVETGQHSDVWGQVLEEQGSCADTSDWKGWGYRIGLYQSTGGQRGDFFLLHVHDAGYDNGVFYGLFGNPPYQLYHNEILGFSALIGFTYQFGNTSCYQVDYNSGTHWHMEAGNAAAVGHYACWYGPRPAGTALYEQDWLGITGANLLSGAAQCP